MSATNDSIWLKRRHVSASEARGFVRHRSKKWQVSHICEKRVVLILRVGWNNFQLKTLSSTQRCEGIRCPYLRFRQKAMQIIHPGYCLPGKGYDHVALT